MRRKKRERNLPSLYAGWHHESVDCVVFWPFVSLSLSTSIRCLSFDSMQSNVALTFTQDFSALLSHRHISLTLFTQAHNFCSFTTLSSFSLQFYQDGWSPLHVATQNEHTQIVMALLQNGANVHALTHVSFYPLC